VSEREREMLGKMCLRSLQFPGVIPGLGYLGMAYGPRSVALAFRDETSPDSTVDCGLKHALLGGGEN